MDKTTRKHLKEDRFAEEVGHSVEYVSSHRNQFILWGAIAVALVVGVGGYMAYQRSQAGEARQALNEALELFHGAVETQERVGMITFATNVERYTRTTEALEKVIGGYPGRDEAVEAEYYLALIELQEGKNDEAVKRLEALIPRAGEKIAPVARLTLADEHARGGRIEQATKEYQYLIDHPGSVVPKARAQFGLAAALKESNPEEAKKLFQELQKEPGAISVLATRNLTDLGGS